MSGPLTLTGEQRTHAAPEPCVVCRRPSESWFRAGGVEGSPLLALHVFCAARLIVAYRQMLNGDTPTIPLPPELTRPPLLEGGLHG